METQRDCDDASPFRLDDDGRQLRARSDAPVSKGVKVCAAAAQWQRAAVMRAVWSEKIDLTAYNFAADHR